MNKIKCCIISLVCALCTFCQVNAEAINKATADTFVAGTTLSLPDFPYNINKEIYLQFNAVIDHFDRIRIGQRQPDMKGGYLWGNYLEINDSTATQYRTTPSDTTQFARKFHRQAIKDTISVNIFIGSEMGFNDLCLQSRVSVSSAGGSVDIPFNWYYGHSGEFYIESVATTGSNASFEANCTDFVCPVWVVGDSYVSISGGRWPWYLREQGYFNFLMDAMGGSTAWDASFDINRLMAYGKPEYLLWFMGMNNADPDEETVQSSWLYQLTKLMDMCEAGGIKLVVSTIPNTPTLCHIAKNEWIRQSGLRYIDMAAAVNATEKGAPWTPGLLANDKVHPTIEGAKVLAAQVLKDFPEIKTLAANSAPGDVNNDKYVDINDMNCLINTALALNNRLKYGYRSDLNDDRSVDVSDINILSNLILGQ